MQVFKVSSQNSATIDIPVPGGGSGSGGLQGFSLTFLFPVEVFTILSLILGRQLHPQCRVMSWGKGVFGLFPGLKKERGSSIARVHGHSSSSTPASEAEEVAKREAKRQETHRQAEEALKRARVLLDQGKRKMKKERKKRLPRSSPLPYRVFGCRLRSARARLRPLLQGAYAKVTGSHSSSSLSTSGACGMHGRLAFATTLVATLVSVCGIAAFWNDYTGGVRSSVACGSWVSVFQFTVFWQLPSTAQLQFRFGLWVQLVYME